MKEIFVDSGAFYALVDQKDPAHPRCKAFIEHNTLPLVTTNFVFAETLSLLTKRLGKSTAIEAGILIKESRLVRLDELTHDLQEAAWQLFRRHQDKEYDFIDCSCFVFMESLEIRSAFSLDRHFRQYGLTTLPT